MCRLLQSSYKVLLCCADDFQAMTGFTSLAVQELNGLAPELQVCLVLLAGLHVYGGQEIHLRAQAPVPALQWVSWDGERRCCTAGALRCAQVAVVQFASEPRVELPLQAIETGAFQACVAELARPPSAIVPTLLCDSARVCRAHCRIFKGAGGRYVLFPHVLAWAGTRLSRPIEVCEEARTCSRMEAHPRMARLER